MYGLLRYEKKNIIIKKKKKKNEFPATLGVKDSDETPGKKNCCVPKYSVTSLSYVAGFHTKNKPTR